MPPTPIVLKSLFDKGGVTLAVAESATAGNLSALIASVSGASSFFQGGVIAYNLRQKVNLLGVDEEHAASCDCVSNRVAKELAKGVRRLCGSDVGMSVTGYAGPYQTPEGVLVTEPFAWLGFDVCGFLWAKKVGVEQPAWLSPRELRESTQQEYAQLAAEEIVEFLKELQEAEMSNVADDLKPLAARLRA